jgi:hypothetical protein
MNQSSSITSDQETSIESTDDFNAEEFVKGEQELRYQTSNSSGTSTSGIFVLTFHNGAVVGRRIKQKQNDNDIPPETSAVDGYLLGRKLKLFREVRSDNVVQICDVERDGNTFRGRYYNIGGNNDNGNITIGW